MDDKKRDDFSIEMPETTRRNSALASPIEPRRAAPALGVKSMSQFTESPPLSILAYCMASISMTVINKYCVSGKDWNLNFFYLGIQSVVCIIAIMACKSAGLITNLAPFNGEKAKKWFPISCLLVAMIYTGTKSLRYLSVPVYTIFKNLTIIVIAYGEVLWFGGSVAPSTLFSFGLMVFSSIVAAWSDTQYAMKNSSTSVAGDLATANALSTLNAGYAWMGLNVFCTSAYVLGMRKVIKKMNFKDWDTMFYNNLLTIPVLFVCTFIAEDWSYANLARNFPVETRNSLLLAMIYSGLGTIFISYCSSWCIRVTSSTTYSMVGALNKLPIAISGLIFFNAPVTFGSVSAIFIAFVSGLIYAWSKVRQSNAAKTVLPTTRPTMSASSQSNRDANS